MKYAFLVINFLSLSIYATSVAFGNSLSKTQKEKGTIQQLVVEDPNFFRSEDEGLQKLSDLTSMKASMKAEYKYLFVSSQGLYKILPKNFDGEKYLGKDVTLNSVGKNFLASNVEITSAVQQQLTLPLAGPNKVLVVITSMNSVAVPVSEVQARYVLFDDVMSVNNFYKVASFGTYWLTGIRHNDADIIYININVNITDCNANLYGSWNNLINTQIQAQGYNYLDYDSVAIVFEDNPNCPAGSAAVVRPLGTAGSYRGYFTRNDFLNYRSGITHEFGHLAGANHSHGYHCSNDNPTSSLDCQFIEYGDSTCVMGSASYNLPNVYQRRRWGWYKEPYKEISENVNRFNLFSPSVEYTFGGARKRQGSGQNFYVKLSGGWSGMYLYLENRKLYPPFDVFVRNLLQASFLQGIKLLVGPADYLNNSSAPSLIDCTRNTLSMDDASCIESSFTIGGRTFTENARTTVMSGSKFSVAF